MRKDVNRIYEEIEKAAERAKAETIPVSAEDLGVALGDEDEGRPGSRGCRTPRTTPSGCWRSRPTARSPKIPEMPLPKSLEDLIGDLLQKADEFDKDADDVTNRVGATTWTRPAGASPTAR